MNTPTANYGGSTDGWVALGHPPLTWLRSRPIGDSLVVTIIGEADLSVEPDLRRALAAGVDAGPRVLVLEVGDLFVDVRGLSALSATWQRGRLGGVEVVLAGPSPLVRRMREMMFTDGRLTAYETVGEALRPAHRTTRLPGHTARSQ